jgi:secreted PhoX family phosphatase
VPTTGARARARTDHPGDSAEDEEELARNLHDSSACELNGGFTSSDNCVFNVQKPGVPDYLGERRMNVGPMPVRVAISR